MTSRCQRASAMTLSFVIALAVGGSACAAGNATETFAGPGPWIDVTDPAYGAVGNGTHEDGPAIQAALTAAAAPVCATVALTCTRQNTFLVSQTLMVPRCVKFRGQCGGGPGIAPAPANSFGSTLKWGGPASTLSQLTPVVLYHDVSQSSLEDMNIDCQSVASCIPSFSRDAERLGEGSVLAQEFFVSLDERPQPFLGHVGDETVEQAALPEQGMDAALGGAGSQLTIHAEAFAGGAQYRQQQDGEGVQEQQTVAALRIFDSERAHAQSEA